MPHVQRHMPSSPHLFVASMYSYQTSASPLACSSTHDHYQTSVFPFACSSVHCNHRTISSPLCLQEWCRGLDQYQGGVHRCRRTDTGQPGEGGEAHSDCCIWGLRVGHWGCHASPHTPFTTSHAARNAITQQVLHMTLHKII